MQPAGFRPGCRVPFGLIQKEPKDQARTALAPRLRQGVPGFAAKAGVGQKLPAFASLIPVKQSARVSSRSALARAPLPWPQTRRRRGAAAEPSYQLDVCSQQLEVRLLGSAVGFGCWGSAPFAPPALAPRQGRAPQARHPSSSARLFDRSEQSERREFLAGPCLGVRAGYSLAQPRSERIRGLNFCLLLVQAKRRCGCRGAQPLRALGKRAQPLRAPPKRHPKTKN
jgi:hypothetical protein